MATFAKLVRRNSRGDSLGEVCINLDAISHLSPVENGRMTAIYLQDGTCFWVDGDISNSLKLFRTLGDG